MSRVRGLRRFPLALAIVSTLLILVAILFFIYGQFSTRHLLNINAQTVKMTRLTDSGKVGAAAISGGGRYIAYSLREPIHSFRKHGENKLVFDKVGDHYVLRQIWASARDEGLAVPESKREKEMRAVRASNTPAPSRL